MRDARTLIIGRVQGFHESHHTVKVGDNLTVRVQAARSGVANWRICRTRIRIS